jgi:arylsulfatase A-like enzyme
MEIKRYKTLLQFGVVTTFFSTGIISSALKAENKKPNLVFVLTDQWRKHALGYRGEDPVLTPNIDKFESWAFSFDNALSCNPVSGPNRACIFTGKYTINNGVFANDVPLDPEEVSSFGKIFKAAGYRTGYIGKWHLNGEGEAATDPTRRQGFDFWVQSLAHNPFSQKYYIAETNKDVKAYQRGVWAPTYETEVGIDFIEKNKNDPFCLVISYNPPHTSGGLGFEDRYMPGTPTKDGKHKYGYGFGGPKEFEALYQGKNYAHDLIRKNIKTIRNTSDECFDAIPGYFGSITAIDKDFGNLMSYLEKNNLLENTIIVFTSDHGESMGSQGLMTKDTWFEESVGVPFLVGWKGKTVHQRSKEVFNSIDFMPSLLGMMQLPIPKSTDGHDFSPLFFGEKFKAPEFAFLSFNFGGINELKASRYWRAIYSKRYTYVLCGLNTYRSFTKDGLVLYDREKDPFQMHPIYKGMGYDKVIKKLHAELVRNLKKTGDPFIEKYWNNPDPGYPTLNKYTIPEEKLMERWKNGTVKK